MKISIITASFNSSANIAESVASVFKQTHKNIEHIIIDGASKDNTVEIVKSTPNRVSQIISEPDKGIYDALNKGIRIANRDVIGFLHSDDIFAHSETVQQIEKVFQATCADGVYGNLAFVNKNDKVIRTWHSSAFKRWHLYFGWMPPHPTLFLKKDVYRKHGVFDSSFTIAGDYDFILRVMKDPDIQLVHLPQIITRMRVGGVSTGNLQQLIRKSKEDLRALKNNGFMFPLAVLAVKNLRKLPQLFMR